MRANFLALGPLSLLIVLIGILETTYLGLSFDSPETGFLNALPAFIIAWALCVAWLIAQQRQRYAAQRGRPLSFPDQLAEVFIAMLGTGLLTVAVWTVNRVAMDVAIFLGADGPMFLLGGLCFWLAALVVLSLERDQPSPAQPAA